MKRIPIAQSLWHPKCRVMKRSSGREVYEIYAGQDLVGYSCRGLLTVIGRGQYQPS